MKNKIVISLGAGVQSSTMALMAAKGEITPMPDFAIFADTQAEPQSVYKWLEWLENELPFPVHRVSYGNLAEKSLKIHQSKKTDLTYLQHDIPAFTLNAGGKKGISWRQCTSRYKIVPIQQFLQKFKKEGIIQWLGISKDEAHRQKDSRKTWIENQYPLIELGLTRGDCLQWMEKNNYPTPPRSACIFCPYHSDKEWNALKQNEPEEFQKAVEYELSLQESVKNQTSLKSMLYLHQSCKPLDKVQFRHQDQPSMFGNECEGHCGV